MSTTRVLRRDQASRHAERTVTVRSYKIGKTIGEGTFGKVKLGVHTPTGQKVAIKILEKNRIVDRADVTRVSREIAILKQIRHPNVIQLYEIIETPKQLYLIMEYAEKGELFEYIVSHRRVDEVQARRFFRQIIAGLSYLHRLRVIHRDLKPENLLLDSQNNIKIVDFGLSNTCADGEFLKTACGSPCYAPPEMVAGKKYKGPAADIWSSGVVLYAMLCGYLPFDDPNTANLYRKISVAEYTIPKHVSPGARDLITRILKTDPVVRSTVADIQKHPWATCDGAFNLEPGIKLGSDVIPVDETVLERLKNYGFDREKARIGIRGNRHNALTSTYYLLLCGKINASSLQNELMKTYEKRNAGLKAKGDGTNEGEEDSFSFETSAFYEEKMGIQKHARVSQPPPSEAQKPGSSSDKDLRPPEPKVMPSKGDNESEDRKSPANRREDETVVVVVEEEEEEEEVVKGKKNAKSVVETKRPENRRAISPQPAMIPARNAHKGLTVPSATVVAPHSRPQSGATSQRPNPNPINNISGTSTKPQRNPHRHAMTLTEESLLRATIAGGSPQSAHNSVARNSKLQVLLKGGNGNNIKRERLSITPRVPITKADDLKSARRSVVGTGIKRPQTASKKYEQIKSELKSILNSREGYSRSGKIVKKPANATEISEIREETSAEFDKPIRPATQRATTRKPAEARINRFKGAFDVACTSTRPAVEIMQEIVRVLERLRLKYKKIGSYLVNCQKVNVKFEMEVMQMEDADFLYIVKFKRIAGELKGYREVASSVLAAMQL